MSAAFRSRVSRLARFALLTAGLVGTALFPTTAAPATALAAESAAPHARTGLLVPVGTIDPIHPPAAASALTAAPTSKSRAKGVQTLSAQRAAAASASRPAAAAGVLEG